MNDDDLEAFGAIVDVLDTGTILPKHKEAFEMCAEVFNRMQANVAERKAKTEAEAKAKAKAKLTGRRAAVEHTRRKNENE